MNKLPSLPSGTGLRPPSSLDRTVPVTVIVPAYNEAASIADTIRSLQSQSAAPVEIIVVDDCSTDRTGQVARSLGVTVIRPPERTGSKAGGSDLRARTCSDRFHDRNRCRHNSRARCHRETHSGV